MTLAPAAAAAANDVTIAPANGKFLGAFVVSGVPRHTSECAVSRPPARTRNTHAQHTCAQNPVERSKALLASYSCIASSSSSRADGPHSFGGPRLVLFAPLEGYLVGGQSREGPRNKLSAYIYSSSRILPPPGRSHPRPPYIFFILFYFFVIFYSRKTSEAWIYGFTVDQVRSCSFCAAAI